MNPPSNPAKFSLTAGSLGQMKHRTPFNERFTRRLQKGCGRSRSRKTDETGSIFARAALAVTLAVRFQVARHLRV